MGLQGVEQASDFTLKTYRASAATALAACGHSLGDILRAGEWRSSAFLRYVDEDMVDGSSVLAAAIDASDVEN